MAAERGCDTVVCGHIHAANKRLYQIPLGSETKEVLYLNSGDWVESCTALEYADGQWSVMHLSNLELATTSALEDTSALAG